MMMRIIALALFIALAASELAPLLHTDNANVIQGSYIVVLKDHLTTLERDSHILELQDHILLNNAEDCEVTHSYGMGAFIGFAARLNKNVLGLQLAHPNVKYIEADQVMSINYKQGRQAAASIITQTGATWGITRTSQRNLNLNGQYFYNSVAGAGVDVYVIDTGILTTHVEFGGRATAVYNAITGESNQDLNGHGTHCAGTIGSATYGIAKQVSLKAVKVLSASGSGTNAGVIAGINYVTQNKSGTRRSVASMSLGGGASQATDDAVSASIAAGIFYSIAAGNDNANACNYSPARTPTACTVGATTNTDAKSSFSNFGTCVNVFAPGSNILSTWIGSNTATNTISGTSMACPHVSGVAALILSQQSSLTPAQMKSWITSNATPNKIPAPGTGSPNLLLYSNPVV